MASEPSNASERDTFDAVEALKDSFLSGNVPTSETARRAEDALSRGARVDSSTAEGWLWLARYSYLYCRPDDLSRYATRAVAAARDCGDSYTLRAALMLEGLGQLSRNHFGIATRLFAESLELAKQLRDVDAEASVLNNLGCASLMSGEYSRAFAILRLAASRSERIRSAAIANIALCAVHCRAPELLSDIDLHELKFGSSGGGQFHRAALFANLCRLALQSLDLQKARGYAEECRKAADGGDPRTVRTARIAPLLVDIATGQMAGLQGVKQILDEADPGEKSVWLVALAEAYELAGQHDEALRTIREVIRQARAEQRFVLSAPDIVIPEGDLDGRLEAKADALQGAVTALMERLTEAAIRSQLAIGHNVYRVYRTERLAKLFAQELGFREAELEQIAIAGRLYDIGALALAKPLLQRRTALRESERLLLERHAEDGADILRRSGLASLAVAARVAAEHHEWWNGQGYPSGKRGEEIFLPARLVALCDSFDALLHGRPHRSALSISAALRELQKESGSHFDPDLCGRFINFIQALYWKHDDLEQYLSEEGSSNPLVVARDRIDSLLSREAK